MESMRTGRSFRELLAGDRRARSLLSAEEIADLFDLDAHFKKIDFIFKRTLGR